MRQLVYTMVISNNRGSFHLWWKKNLVKHQKASKYYEKDCSSVWSVWNSIWNAENKSRPYCFFKDCAAMSQYSKRLTCLLKEVVALFLQSMLNFAFLRQIKFGNRFFFEVMCSNRTCDRLLSPSMPSIVLCVVRPLQKHGKFRLSSETILDHAAFWIWLS